MKTSSFIAETSLDVPARAALVGRCQLRPMIIDSDDDQLQRRYTEGQRSHLPAGHRLLIDGARLKRQMLFALRDRADLPIEKSPPPATEHERPMAGECVLAECEMRAFVTCFAHWLPQPALSGSRARSRQFTLARGFARAGRRCLADLRLLRQGSQHLFGMAVACDDANIIRSASQRLRQGRVRRNGKR